MLGGIHTPHPHTTHRWVPLRVAPAHHLQAHRQRLTERQVVRLHRQPHSQSRTTQSSLHSIQQAARGRLQSALRQVPSSGHPLAIAARRQPLPKVLVPQVPAQAGTSGNQDLRQGALPLASGDRLARPTAPQDAFNTPRQALQPSQPPPLRGQVQKSLKTTSPEVCHWQHPHLKFTVCSCNCSTSPQHRWCRH